VATTTLMVVAFLVAGRENVYRAPSIFALPGLLVLLGVIVWYSRRQPKVGLWILAGMAFLMAGALAPLVHNLGLIEASFVTEFGPQLGGAAEVPLLLIGLFFRSRERRANLERLQAMAHTDPLTGLANHRVLQRRLEAALSQARKDPLAGAVLRVHVGNLADIHAEYGREAGEAALVRAGECVAKEAREGDLVAREQGDDIVLVLGGHPTQGQTAIAGRNVIARGLKFSGRLPPGVTLKLRVAGFAPPLPASGDPAGLLQTLARLLLDIENDPHGRALRFVGSPDSSPWRSSPWPKHDEPPPQPPPTVDELLSAEHSRPRRPTNLH
jgi:GGDEF domain-containing protein